MTTTLERKPVAPVTIDTTDEEFAKECAELLGYHSLAQSVKHETSAAKLKAVLAELDIRPFTTASVNAYKAEMQQKANAPATPHCGDDIRHPWTWSQMRQMTQMQAMLSQSQQQPWHWVRRPLADATRVGFDGIARAIVGYREPVPEFALQSALDIKKRCPDAEFLIESFEQQQRQADPFLIVKCGETEFYIEVWAEAAYKQQREL